MLLENNDLQIRKMKVRFIGGVETVTGSCSMLEYINGENKQTVLVDCGMYQGEGAQNLKNLPFDAKNISKVILTHAHLDHCGAIPLLYKYGYTGEVYCTSMTADCAREILLDSANISNGELYKISDVDQIKFNCVDLDSKFSWGQHISIGKDFFFYFLRSSHILGAVSVGFIWQEADFEKKTIVFSGDIGASTLQNEQSLLIKDNQYPHNGRGNDFIVLESTYGARKRECFNYKQRL
ncbi:MBL fold metallo-hydrolase [Thiospirochaeta perfilievii]|uniref:MBL fold metallo-hydrolase n=1 Tax=Thiospirochaeta perfilievii TaxID=252967 RepID=A0A5C1QB11_9SPIO|nr:MBL fold metallo-hydrolase [Thiospirochaeta perfilievii]QEN03342.1 MBL fold metallo-hydrolase [Thiospirochaeta perfilievii]